MRILKINNLQQTTNNITIQHKSAENKNYSTNTINSANINALNFHNRSLISFNGYFETLEKNYFQLPINKETGRPFEPDIYQKAAAENLYKGNDVVVTAPTGTGKTAIAHYIISKNLKEGKKTFYTTPLKALSNDKVREFQKIYGKDNIGLITGDKKINKDAPIVIMTTEVYRNMVVQDNMRDKNPLLEDVNTVVFDELHYLGDVDRGSVWEQSIIFTDPKVQLLSLSGTMANPGKISDWMASIKGQGSSEKVTPDEKYRAKDTGIHTVLINVPPEKRHVPLEYNILNVQAYENKGRKNIKGGVKYKHNQELPFAQSDNAEPSRASYADVVKKLKAEDKLPAIFFVFSKREGKSIVKYLSENTKKLTTDEETDKIEEKINKYNATGKYLGESLDIQALKNGFAVHNAGMLPEQKELIEELFQEKLIKVVISTETLSAGINMPARTTVISALRKPTDTPDGLDHKRYITPNEFHQMAGRAGRRGIDKKGYCYSLATNKSQRAKFEDLIKIPSNDIESHFNIDYSFVATANDAFRDKTQLKQIFRNSLQAYDKNPDKRFQKAKEMTAEFMRKEKILKDFGYLNKDNTPTIKGQMLSHLNGYAQIPIIDSIASGELFGLSPVQLAGYVGGLANLECAPRSTDRSSNRPMADDYYMEDNLVDSLVQKFDRKKGVYDYNLYRPIGKELKYNKEAVERIYDWADKNNRFDNSTKNWRHMYYKYIKDSRIDEGKLFKEIMMTIDLLKQMDEIAQIGAQLTDKENYRKYYNELSDTIKASLELLNQPPTMTGELAS